VDGEVVAEIGRGLVAFVAAMDEDTPEDADYLADKLAGLRVFSDDAGHMNLSVRDVGGELLVVPNFTVGGDCRKGRRPSFSHAARPEEGRALLGRVVEAASMKAVPTKQGVFGAVMTVQVENDGPVSLLLDSKRRF